MATIGREEFEQKLRAKCITPKPFRFLELEMVNEIMLAYRLSKYGHRNQERANGERYFEHPKRTALILMDELNIYDPPMLISALLHDVEEDSFVLTWWDIEFVFGKKVKQMVRILTKERSLPKPQRDKKYYGELQKANVAVKLIKLADRLDNIRGMDGWPPEKIEEYIEETTTVFLPIAEEVNEYLYGEIKKICEKYQKSG